MNYRIISILILFSILLSCKKDHCSEILIVTKHFESEFGCENTKHTLDIDLNNDCTIIRSKSDYDSKVSGSCLADIDFSKYDLVIGKQSSGNSNDTILYDYRYKCPGNELTLTVDIVQTNITFPDNVTYHALIPKIGDEETLNIIVNVK